MLRTKVLVVGAGPSGATAARFLAGSGIDTILIERDLSYIKPCGGLMPSSALEELQVPQSVVKKTIKKLRITSPKGQRIHIELIGGHLCITERGLFDTTLRELAMHNGASLIEAEFVHCQVSGNQIISVIRKKSTNEEFSIRSDYLIASDGITYKVGSTVNLPKPACLFTVNAQVDPLAFATSVLADGSSVGRRDSATVSAAMSLNDTDSCEFWFGSQHASHFYSWVFPSPLHTSIGTGALDARRLTPMLDAFVRRRLNKSLHDLEKSGAISRRRAFRIPSWNRSIFNIKNILFTGDAAGFVMPVTYEGIYYAMKSGEFASRAIVQGKPHAYKNLWNSRFRRRFSLMRRIAGLFYQGDEQTEKWVAIHKSPEVQEIAMALWLRKESGNRNLLSYLNCFRHLLKS